VPSPSRDGVGSREYLRIVFAFQGGASFTTLILDLTTGEPRIGIHVIAFASGANESVVDTPAAQIRVVPTT
jgi:hypothetical protein